MATASPTIEDFKAATLRKLDPVRCPLHGRGPDVDFRGTSLADVAIYVKSCCEDLSARANAALAVANGIE